MTIPFEYTVEEKEHLAELQLAAFLFESDHNKYSAAYWRHEAEIAFMSNDEDSAAIWIEYAEAIDCGMLGGGECL